MPFFNYSAHVFDLKDASRWERGEFLAALWRIYGDDRRWTPPDYAALKRELDPRRNSHLARQQAMGVFVDALQRTGVRPGRQDQPVQLASLFELPLAASLVLIDPRRKGTTAHLALLRAGNDEEGLERLYYRSLEALAWAGYRRIVGPTGLSPHLGSSAQIDAWDRWPALHAPNNPPYVPDILGYKLRPFLSLRLYRAEVPATCSEPSGPARLSPFDPARLAGDLLPLLVAATENPAGFPPPDVDEASFLLRWLRPEPLTGLLAEVDGNPAGFILLGPDTSGSYRTTAGGRRPWQRGALAVARQRPVQGGRLLFGGVLPAFRRQGISRQMWSAVQGVAAAAGWRSLAAGPVYEPSAAAAFLQEMGAAAAESYALYEASF